jgi:2,3-bisphosphoglycerate-independent phosphoglycerate mutase
VCGQAERTANSADEAIRQAAERGETDEFVAPTVILEGDEPVGPVEDGDAVLFFNFRADRARQLSEALIAGDAFDGFERCRRPELTYASLMPYDTSWDRPYLLNLPPLEACLADVLSDHDKTQFHAAETEKYPHVTYFFNAKVEQPFEGETRHIEPSPKVATYDLQPEMSAAALTDAVCQRLDGQQDDFVLVNFANPDMVGHTGDVKATVKACETVDACLGRVLDATEAAGGVLLVLADHGNAEMMVTQEGTPHTAHTTNPVPFVLAGAGEVTLRTGGVLGDVAPTVLELLGVATPPEMTGTSLIAR